MTDNEFISREYEYRLSTDSRRCINCKYINCKKIKDMGKPLRIVCNELSNYCGEDIYVEVNNKCFLWVLGYA